MGLKRPIFLISGTVIGTVGVLSYVPSAPGKGTLLSLPPLKQSAAPTSQPATTTAAPSNLPTQAPTQAASAPPATPAKATAKSTTATKSKKLATKTATKTSTKTPTQQTTTAAQAPAQTPAPAPAPTKTQPPASTATRTLDGSTVQTPFGPVQVQITVQGTKIINAAALQTPQGGRSSWINQQAVPYLVQETLAAQSANIQGVGGATWTSQSWVQSLQSALAKM